MDNGLDFKSRMDKYNCCFFLLLAKQRIILDPIIKRYVMCVNGTYDISLESTYCSLQDESRFNQMVNLEAAKPTKEQGGCYA